MNNEARPAMPDMLQIVADTAEPLQPIVWDDPIQFTQAELAAALFDGLLRSSCDGVDKKLLYPAIQAISRNANGMGRAYLAGSALLAKYHYKEGIRAIMDYVKIHDGHASQERVPILMDLLKTYGTAAKPLIPEIKEVVVKFNAELAAGQFPADCNKLRVDAVEETIAFLEAAKDQPELRSMAK